MMSKKTIHTKCQECSWELVIFRGSYVHGYMQQLFTNNLLLSSIAISIRFIDVFYKSQFFVPRVFENVRTITETA